jgi:hypothetical protein
MKIYLVMWEKDCYTGSIDERVGVMVVFGAYLDKETAEGWAKKVNGEVEEWEAQ